MKPLWKTTAEKNEFQCLENDISTDVLIIGGGIAGLLTAYMLKGKGIDCTVVEKNRICSGTTDKTTAKITGQHGLIYHRLIKDFGTENAKLYYTLNQKAIEGYRSLSEKYPCDFERKDNYIYTTVNRQKIMTEIKALNSIGAKCDLFDSVPLPIKIAGAVTFPDQAQFNPVKLLYAISKELKIYENTFVRSILGSTAYTDKATIKARKIIVTTHFPFINRHGSYSLKMYQDRSYVIALKNAAEVDGMYLDESETGYSFRNYNDLLFIGGGGHRTGKKGGNYEELRTFAKKHFPRAEEKFHWATQDCITLDGIPYIGNYCKTTPDLYVATGFNKWGMTSSFVAAEMLSDMICGKKHPGEELFSPSRSILKPQLILNGLESVLGLITPIPKRCPHLGCALRYNRTEHSWDCPCHGSRFNEDGKILDNPANKEMKK